MLGGVQMDVEEKGERTDKEEVKEDRLLAKQKEHQRNSRNQIFFEQIPTILLEFK